MHLFAKVWEMIKMVVHLEIKVVIYSPSCHPKLYIWFHELQKGEVYQNVHAALCHTLEEDGDLGLSKVQK